MPEGIKAELARAQGELRTWVSTRGIRWTGSNQIHLTLRFLGNVEATRVEALTAVLRGVCRNFAPLQLRAETVGFFPNHRFPRIVWVGVRDAADYLGALQRAIQEATREFTAEPLEDRFIGHLTLARIKSIQRAEAEALARCAERWSRQSFGEWTAETVELISSELARAGAIYTTMAEIKLERPV